MREFLICVAVFCIVEAGAQQAQPVLSSGACSGCTAVLNGNDTLGLFYSKDTCGLNYIQVSQKIGQRFAPAGAVQPVTVAVTGIPVSGVVYKAILWADASGNGVNFNTTITNPAMTTDSFPMVISGQAPDKCWGYAGTYTYRADVTSAITGNGQYTFSGFPVGATNDVDGFTLIVMYIDTAVQYEGHITIWDGAMLNMGVSMSLMVTGLNVCGTPSENRNSMIVADLQNLGSTFSFNGSNAFTVNEDWWNYVEDTTTSLTTSQTACTFNTVSTGDCFNMVMAGVYFQTTGCMSCWGGVGIAEAGDGQQIYYSEILTPDGDGSNDIFKLSGNNLTSIHCTIYDMKGAAVYAWDGVDGGWNGKNYSGVDSAEGLYVFSAEITDADGILFVVKGKTQLLR